eukprot:CAMPEP_0117661836 /NCGR_PEP_ID=MMETSP0804-20121206/7746_1 /TAXON_ID=1074897 /ORGANISM="Tetraselmis astigmatica, Strain CCMP880" /LENGTH=207 /DNA_ID=CAMNT_0005468723 /DNA_START=81 /DNA_END=707 /DNA_ORIENTATION=-
MAVALPPVAAILLVFGVIGAEPPPQAGSQALFLLDPVSELWLSVVALCAFLTFYEVFDVMGVGFATAKQGIKKETMAEEAAYSEEVTLAMRTKQNQLEQMPVFITATACFSVFVNGPVGGCLAMIWVLLRAGDSFTYRGAVGLRFVDMGLTKFTTPCYFILNRMSVPSFSCMIEYIVSMMQIAVRASAAGGLVRELKDMSAVFQFPE